MRIAALATQVVLAALAVWAPTVRAETQPSSTPQGKSVASVPSFDCARAASAREKTICSDPALSALDGQLGRLYQEKQKLLSPQGASLLQDSERGWLRFIGVVCTSDGPKNKLWLTQGFCLTRQYNDRIRELQQVEQVGPFVFNRVDIYTAQPSGDETGSATGFYVQHVAYPQIDNPRSPEVRAWNQETVHSLSTDGDCGSGDDDVGYKVGYANTRFISVEWTDSIYCHGAAHGQWSITANNTVLSSGVRALTAEDLFGSGGAWISALKNHFWAALTKAGWNPPKNNQTEVKKELESVFVQTDRWLFTKDGLQVAFAAYEGGCYACTPQPATVPWSDLRPLLRKGAIAP